MGKIWMNRCRVAVFVVATGLLMSVQSAFAADMEFGAMVGGRHGGKEKLDRLLEYVTREGNFTILRGAPGLAAEHGLDVTSNLNHLAGEGTLSRPRELPVDLMAVYWRCRTNLPAYAAIDQAWEVWNEPDFFFVRDNADRMASVVKACYWGVKAGDPDAKVLMPSLAFRPTRYALELFRNGMASYSEGYNFHFYGWAQDFAGLVRQHRRLASAVGWEGPWWCTEAGYFQMPAEESEDPQSLARQQAFHERLAIEAWVEGVDHYLPFILTPYTHGDGNDLGLVDADMDPRPALESYLYLSNAMPECRPLYRVVHDLTGRDLGVVLVKPDGGWWVCLWSPIRYKSYSLRENLAERRDTGFPLILEFPKGTDGVRLGLRGGEAIADAPVMPVRVSAEANVYVHAYPECVRVRDCRMVPVEDPIVQGEAEFTDPELVPASDPSPVVVQILFPEPGCVPNKPAQTYRFDAVPADGLEASLAVYNFSETNQTGRIRLEVPDGWRIEAGDEIREPNEISIPPLSTVRRAMRFVPTIPWSDDKVRRRSGERLRIRCRWQGASGICDSALAWLEPWRPTTGDLTPIPVEGWIPRPGRESAWDLFRMPPDKAWCIAKEPTRGSGRIAMYYRIDRESMNLAPDSVFAGNLRIPGAPRPVSFRAVLITRDGEVFRSGLTQPLSDARHEFAFRLGDFAPGLWTRMKTFIFPPIDRVEFVGLLFLGLKPDDVVEMGEIGIIGE